MGDPGADAGRRPTDPPDPVRPFPAPMQSQISGRGAHAPPRRTDRRAPRDRIPGARRVHQHHPTSHSWPDRATPVSTSSSPMAMIAPLASPPPSNLHQNPSPNRAASSAPSCVGAVGAGGGRRFGVPGSCAVVPGSAWSYVGARGRTPGRAVVPRGARSYPGTRGRTPGRAVVPRGARSYLRGALRYDRAELRTTGSTGNTTAPDYVRPRGFTYDRAGPMTHGDETGHAPRHPGLHRPAARRPAARRR